MGKHPSPPWGKHVSTWAKRLPHFHTQNGVPKWRVENTPQVFKGPGPEEMTGLSAWEKLSSQ